MADGTGRRIEYHYDGLFQGLDGFDVDALHFCFGSAWGYSVLLVYRVFLFLVSMFLTFCILVGKISPLSGSYWLDRAQLECTGRKPLVSIVEDDIVYSKIPSSGVSYRQLAFESCSRVLSQR